MIQGNFVQTWINEEWPKLAATVGKKTTYLDTVWNDNWFDECDTIPDKSTEVIEKDQDILPFSPSVVGPERRKRFVSNCFKVESQKGWGNKKFNHSNRAFRRQSSVCEGRKYYS